jgi:hypothetical protein
MNKILGMRPLSILIIYIALDIICIGMGMGVPFFCILLGFLVGWFVARYITFSLRDVPQVLSKVLKYSIISAGFTFLAMLALWGPFTSYLFDPTKDLAQTGIPMILYEPLASLIGWIVLMVFISPFLQLLTALFSAYLTLLGWFNKQRIPDNHLGSI